MSLRDIIKAAGGSLGEHTVMGARTDPFRMDTPANHRDAEWLADAWRACGLWRIHCRGLHYALVMRKGLSKPNGEPYRNTDDDWNWLQTVANQARWLGYLDFESILDERNDAPEVWRPPATYGDGVQVKHDAGAQAWPMRMPSFSVACSPPHASQAYRLVIVGEKASLRSVLQSICESYEAELVLPTGDISNSLLYGIAKRANDDGRPCRVFYLSDFDPSGLSMPVAVARKLQALCHLKFNDLDIEVHRCALLADQVRELGLPETPLKESEKRAGRWRERFDCEQTEIDALSTLNPGALRKIVTKALDPYFDETLQRRQREAYGAAVDETHRRIDAAMAGRAAELAAAAELVQAAAAAMEAAAALTVPLFEEIAEEIEPAVPEGAEPRVQADEFGTPLFTSLDPFKAATAALLREKL